MFNLPNERSVGKNYFPVKKNAIEIISPKNHFFHLKITFLNIPKSRTP